VIDPETSLDVMRMRFFRDLQTEPTALPLRARALPVIGAALLWAEREVVPGLEDYVTTGIGHRSTRQKTMGIAQDQRSLVRGSSVGRAVRADRKKYPYAARDLTLGNGRDSREHIQ
jgi:hypothetical protein